MQSSHFICHLATPQVPEPESAVKVARTNDVLISCAAHRVAAAVADDGACAEALVQVPHLDAAVCTATYGPCCCAAAAVDAADLQRCGNN